ncbi:MAG: sialidase family protein [Trebonia sp.]
MKRHIATFAAIVGCAIGLAAPAMAATAAIAKPAAGTAIPRGLRPMSASWLTPGRGIVLGYQKRATKAKPYLITTGNGGKTWQSLTAPPVPYPADNDQPQVTWEDGAIAAEDGTHIYVSTNEGRHWSAERLAGLKGSFFVAAVAINHGRVFALVTTDTSAAVYSGVTGKGVLSVVRGLSITGSGTYGDISTLGALQVDLGNNYQTERYWYSRDGVHFTAAALPCPVSTSASLGGVRAGKVIALCSGSPSDIGLGQNDKQVFIAAKLGGTFKRSGPVFDSSNTLGFVTASDRDMTIVTAFALYVTFNAGQTWTPEIPQNNGATFAGLWYPSFTTGYVVCNTYNNAAQPVDTLYRTTDSGRAWRAVPLP